MRIRLLLVFLLLGNAAPSHATSAKEDCEKFANLTYLEANKEYEELLSLSRKLDSKVGNYLKSNTPQDNPDFSETAKELGSTIGKTYALCVCNNPISESKSCKEFIEHIKKTRGVK